MRSCIRPEKFECSIGGNVPAGVGKIGPGPFRIVFKYGCMKISQTMTLEMGSEMCLMC